MGCFFNRNLRYRPASNSFPVKTFQRDVNDRCTWSFRVRVSLFR